MLAAQSPQVVLRRWFDVNSPWRKGFYEALVEGHVVAKIARRPRGCWGSAYEIRNALGGELIDDNKIPEEQRALLPAKFMRLKREEGVATDHVLRQRVLSLIQEGRLQPEPALKAQRLAIEAEEFARRKKLDARRAAKWTRLQAAIEAVVKIKGNNRALIDAYKILVNFQSSGHLGVDIDDALPD